MKYDDLNKRLSEKTMDKDGKRHILSDEEPEGARGGKGWDPFATCPEYGECLEPSHGRQYCPNCHYVQGGY